MLKCVAGFVVLSAGMCLGQSFVESDMAPGPTSEPKKTGRPRFSMAIAAARMVCVRGEVSAAQRGGEGEGEGRGTSISTFT